LEFLGCEKTALRDDVGDCIRRFVVLVRDACFGFEWTDLLRLAGLVVLAFAMWRLAISRLTRRLID